MFCYARGVVVVVVVAQPISSLPGMEYENQMCVCVCVYCTDHRSRHINLTKTNTTQIRVCTGVDQQLCPYHNES